MASDAIFIFDLEGSLLETNQVWEGWLGYSHDELLKMNLVEIETVENANRLPKRVKELLECGQALYESALIRKDGSIFPIELNVRLIEYQGQQAAFSIARDISQRKAIETAEHEQRVLADVLHDISVDLTGTLQFEDVLERILKNIQRVIRHDAANIMILEDNLVYVKKHRGYSEREQSDRLSGAPIPIENMHLLRQMMESRIPLIISDVRNSPYWYDFRSSLWVRSYAGAPVIYKGQLIGFINLDGALPGLYKEEQLWRLQTFANYAAVAIQNARLYSHVQQMAQVDELTGLYNRRGLTFLAEREVHRSLRYRRPLSVLMIDVDHFKTFNDLYSYMVGDEVLSNMSERLRKNVRNEDLVCRWGGDEFVVLLIECSMAEALVTAEHLRQVITERPFVTARGPLPVTVSIGVAEMNPEHADLNKMIDLAGDSLHHAKSGGRNQVSK
jgi:diguanylate cyclase (GGDEF)-like protein/PAS domain S-box-containing protein